MARLGAWARRLGVLCLLVVCAVPLVYASSREIARADVDTRFPYAVLPTDPIVLHDLELSNVLVLTTLDGSLHGLDRTSGHTLWSLRSDAQSDEGYPIVSSTIGTRTMAQLAHDAMTQGDPTLVRLLQGEGLYIVEPSSGGDLYLLRVPIGASKPHLEKLPFSLPQLVSMSPFSLSTDDTRIFVADKHTSLVELNVFTGKIRATYHSRDRDAYPQANPAAPDTSASAFVYTDHGASADMPLDDDALESPWVYMGRTDYTLRVHTRGAPDAAQTLRYRVFGPNMADRDIVQLWEQTSQPVDARAVLVSPENATVLCYDVHHLSSSRRASAQGLPPVVWTRDLSSPALDVFDVVFAPPTTTSLHAPLLRPVLVPHRTGALPALLEQAHRRPTSDMATYVGLAPDGSLYALGHEHVPLVDMASIASVLQEGNELTHLPTTGSPTNLLRAWTGSYQVPATIPPSSSIPQLGAPRPIPQLSAAPASDTWLTRRLTAQLLGFGCLLALIVRGAYLIWRDAKPPRIAWDTLSFDSTDVWQDENEIGAETTSRASIVSASPAAPAAVPAPALADTSADGLDDDEGRTEPLPDADGTKRKRRRRGKRAGAAVQARQARRDASSSEATPEASSVPAVETDALPTSLQISDDVLGYGSSGTVVFRGTFQGRAVAVKRLLRDFVQMASKEVSLLQSADNHPNVIRYYCQELTPHFLFIALEECPASLADLIERPMDHPTLAPLFEPRQAFRQVTAGLQHLHSLSIVHRDIKPGNILVTLTSQQKLRFLLSDFGISKRIDGMAPSTLTQSTHAAGTVGWRAPELLRPWKDASRVSRAVDIFSLGCVAFYMLTHGGHPFGAQYEREMHIVQQDADLSALASLGEDTVEATALLQRMIAPTPSARPTADEVARHPFFWAAQKRLAFLQDVSDRFESLERDPPAPALELLERQAVEIVGTDWRTRFDKAFLDDLGKFRTYNASSVQDLLRVIRNKKHHAQDLPLALRKQLSLMPEGFLHYFTHRFPALFMHVYQVMEQLPVLRQEPTFRAYYQEDT